jgi:hypothetical protein
MGDSDTVFVSFGTRAPARIDSIPQVRALHFTEYD